MVLIRCLAVLLGMSSVVVAQPLSVRWLPQTSGVSVRLRGVSAVSAEVAWASGAQGTVLRTVLVLALSLQRGPAVQAQTLYAETADSVAARQRAAEQRRLAAEPSLSIEQGRPTKRDRRQLADWQRWSASADGLDSGSKS